MNKLLIFVAGVVAGSLVTYVVYKNKVVEKINADLEQYHSSNNHDITVNDSTEELVNTDDNKKVSIDTLKTAYNKICEENNYAKEGEASMKKEPYTIEPDEYGEYIDYDQVELTFYADGILVDDMTDEVLDIKNTVGEFFYDHFGENDDPDTVYVRNDELRKEFEVTRDDRNSSDVISTAYINEYE